MSRWFRRDRWSVLLTACFLLVLGQVLAPSSAVAASTFTEDFDGPAGSSVNGSNWQSETADNVNNHERQYYASGTSNAQRDGQGHLVITAKKENPRGYNCWYGRCEYTSARLNTAGKFSQAYGHFETRMKIPRGQGMVASLLDAWYRPWRCRLAQQRRN
jgi:beta-glucanase (GH16 family)